MQRTFVSTKLLIYIFPLLLGITLFYNLYETKYSFIQSVDPEYIHLISSVNLANGQYKLHSIESPGSSLYIFGAMTVKFTHIISASEYALMDDFLLNPEKYVYRLRFSLIILTVLSLFFLGRIIYNYTGSILQSVFLQTIPFISPETLRSATSICPENFLIIVMIWYVALLVMYSTNSVSERKAVYYFTILTALGLATKLTFVPFTVLPLLVLSKNKYRFSYLILTILLTLVIAFPATLQYQKFTEWVNGLIFHSGRYGSGKEQIIDMGLFAENLVKIFKNELVFSFTFISLTATVIFQLLSKNINYKSTLFFGAIMLVLTFQIALTAKHFALRYIIPSLMLTAYIIYELINFHAQHLKLLTEKKIKILLCLSGLLIIGSGTTALISFNKKQKAHRQSRFDAYKFLKKNVDNKPLLITPNYFGSSALEYSLYFSAIWTGDYSNIYFKRLNELYPNTYVYFIKDKKFMQWNFPTDLYEILKRHKSMYLYAALDASEKAEEDFNNELKEQLNYYNKNGHEIIKINEVYHSLFDVIYKLDIDTNRLNDLYTYEQITCDMEQLSQDGKYYYSSQKDYKFTNSAKQNGNDAFSGKFSQFLDKNHPWGSGIILNDIKQGNQYVVTVWKKSSDNNCLLVASAENADDLYVLSNRVVETKNGWEKIILSFEADNKTEGKPIHIYIWYNGQNFCIADDLNIQIGQIQKHI
jgi:hypothetical protein